MPLTTLKDLCSGLAVPLVLGLASSMVRISRFGVRSWRQFVSSVLASCFVAVLVHWGLDYVEFQPTVNAAIIGISSYMGGSLLDALQMRFLKEIKDGKVKEQVGYGSSEEE